MKTFPWGVLAVETEILVAPTTIPEAIQLWEDQRAALQEMADSFAEDLVAMRAKLTAGES